MKGTPSPLAGEGGPKGRMRGIERSEMAPWRANRRGDCKHLAVDCRGTLALVLKERSHLASLDPPHPPRSARRLPPQMGGRGPGHPFKMAEASYQSSFLAQPGALALRINQ